MRGRNKNCDPKFTSILIAINYHTFDHLPNKYSVLLHQCLPIPATWLGSVINHPIIINAKATLQLLRYGKGTQAASSSHWILLSFHWSCCLATASKVFLFTSFYTILWILQRVRGNQRNTSALQTAGCRDTPSRPSKCESIAQDQQTGRGFFIFKRRPGASSREERRQPPFIENTQCHHFIRYQVKKKKGSELKWKLIRFRNSRFLSLESYYILVTFSPSKPNHHLKTPSPSSSHCCNYQLSWSGRLTLSRAHGKQV